MVADRNSPDRRDEAAINVVIDRDLVGSRRSQAHVADIPVSRASSRVRRCLRMSTTDDPDLAALQTVTSRLTEAVASIELHHWNSETPCGDWDLTALVDHITGGNWFTVAILAGELAGDAMAATMERFGGESATIEAAILSLGEQVAAFHRPEVLDQSWSHVAGDISGRQILRLRLHDLIVHSWDVEETLSPGANLPDDLVRWGLGELVDDDSLTAQHFDLVNALSLRSCNNSGFAYLEAFGR